MAYERFELAKAKPAPSPPKKGNSKNNKDLALISENALSIALKDVKLTLKQRVWFREYIKTGNATEAARRAYNCTDGSAEVIGCENLLKLKAPITLIMDIVGLTDAKLAKVMNEGLDAEKIVVAIHKGEICDEKSYIDHPTRKQFAELAAKVKGHLKERIKLEPMIHDPGDYNKGDDPMAYIEACLNGREKKE